MLDVDMDCSRVALGVGVLVAVPAELGGLGHGAEELLRVVQNAQGVVAHPVRTLRHRPGNHPRRREVALAPHLPEWGQIQINKHIDHLWYESVERTSRLKKLLARRLKLLARRLKLRLRKE
eukprot:8002044-Pyramimonas_sp.AAC.1